MIEKIREWFKPKTPKVEIPYRVHFHLEDTRYIDIESLEENDKRSFFIECKEILKSPAFKILIDNELQDIANHAFRESVAESFFYDRFEAKGVARIRERLEEYASRIETEEVFDAHDYIPN